MFQVGWGLLRDQQHFSQRRAPFTGVVWAVTECSSAAQEGGCWRLRRAGGGRKSIQVLTPGLCLRPASDPATEMTWCELYLPAALC